MLASHVGATLFPPVMGDDSMEISSEHGHNEGDDIDIDIDFTAGPADEDAILEDAASNIGFGEERQASPAVGNDDLMIDDGEDTYQMNDEDLVLDDGDQRMEPDAVTESFSMAGSSHSEDEQMLAGNMPSSDGHNMWTQEHTELSAESQDTHVEDLGETVHEETEDTNDEVAPDTQDSTHKPSDHCSRAATPRASGFVTEVPETEAVSSTGLEQEDQSATEIQSTEIQTTSNLSPKPIDESFNPEDEQSEHGHLEDELYEDQSLENEDLDNEAAVIHPTEPSAPPHVVVAYRNEDFPLFPITNSDDPNHFFLSDLTILDKDLGELLAALRDVIYEDIPDDQELTMDFTDFKFEIDESCARLNEFTLGQIIELYNKLLHNENAEPRPLYIVLDFRPRYSSRIRNLMMGAAEGKILSDLIPWIDGGENLNESGPEDGSTDGQELESEEFVLEELKPEEDVESSRAEESLNTLTQDSVKETHTEAVDAPELSPKQAFSPEVLQEPKLNNHARENQELIDHPSLNDRQKSEARHDTRASVEHDEDDLIDYSDDEEQADKEQAPVKSSVGGSEADNVTPNNEYDAINEHLRLRSESLKAENRRRSTPSVAGSNDANHPRDDLQGQIDFEGGAEGDTHDNDNGGEEHENEDLTTDDTLVAAEEEEEEEYDQHQNDDVVVNQPYPLESGTFTEEDYQHEIGEEDYNGENEPEIREELNDENEALLPQEGETEYETREEANDEGGSFQVHENDAHDGQEVEGDEIDLNGFFEESNLVPHAADTAESSVTVVGDDTLYDDFVDVDNDDSKEADESYTANAADQQINNDQDDEIDYEDDEDDKEQRSSLAQSPLHATNGSAIKRSLAEVEDDDAGSSRDQDAKRPRS